MSESRHRSKLEIMAGMVRLAAEKPTNQTQFREQMKLSYHYYRTVVGELLLYRYLTQSNGDGRFGRCQTIYASTPRGQTFLQHCEPILSLLR